MKIIISTLVLVLYFAFSTLVIAGGPLNVSNSNQPIVYPAGGVNITLNYDLGPLGSRTNEQADALLDTARSLWNNVSTSTVTLSQGADLPFDFNLSQGGAEFNNFSDGINPIVYDTNGEITDAIFGVGAKNFILGFAGSAHNGTNYIEGQSLINGFLSISDAVLVTVLAHEIGHFFGMDHTQLDDSQGLLSSNYPLMYPIAFRTSPTLHNDDIAAVSTIYPSSTFTSNYGTLYGRFHQADGTFIRGANIWARNTSNGEIFSTVSDYLKTNSGDFRLTLPPGTYEVHAESIQNNFTGGSSVGPYSNFSGDISFQAPHPISPIQYAAAEIAANRLVSISVGGSIAYIEFNQNGIIPSIDSDGDGILNAVDACTFGETGWTSNSTTDFDGDGCRDATEDLDDDNDTLTDIFETTNGLDPLDATGINGADGDADGDSFTNAEEQTAGTDASAATGATSNPGFIQFSSPTYSVAENGVTASILINRTGGSVGAVSVNCFTNDSATATTATEATDYTGLGAGTLFSWADGDTTTRSCDITILDDSSFELDEIIQMDLSLPGGGAKLGTLNTSLLTITDNDVPGMGDIVKEFNIIGHSFVTDRNSNLIYVSVTSDGTIAIIDMNSLELVDSIFVGTEPRGMAISPDGNTLYVAIAGSSSLAVVDLQTRTSLSPIALPTPANSVEIDYRGRVYAAPASINYQSPMVYDPATSLVTQPFPPTSTCAGCYKALLQMSPDGKTLFIANQGISPATMGKYDISGDLPVFIWKNEHSALGSNGQDLWITPTGNHVYYAVGGGNRISGGYDIAQIDANSMGINGIFLTGAYPEEIITSPNGKVAYAIHTSGHIDVWDAETFVQITEYPATGKANELITDQTGKYLLAAFPNKLQIYKTVAGGTVDFDADGIDDSLDSCPAGESGWASNATTDFDGDGCRDATEDADDDSDGLLDTFEIANGLNPLDAAGVNGATGDADSDGFTNIEEQTAGSDASAANDFPGTGDILKEFNITGHSFVADRNSNILYVSVTGDNTVAIIDMTSLELVDSIFVGSEPRGMAISLDGNTLYVATAGATSLAVVDLQTRTLLAPIPLPYSALDVEVDYRGRIYASPVSTSVRNIMVYDPSTSLVTEPFSFACAGCYNSLLEMSPDGQTLFIANRGLSPGTLAKYDVSGDLPVLTWQNEHGALGSNGQDLWLTPTGNHVYYAVGGGNRISGGYDIAQIDANSLAINGSFETGAYPREIVTSPNGKVTYAVHTTGHIDVWDAETFVQITEYPSTGEASELITDKTGKYLLAAFPNKLQIYKSVADGSVDFDADGIEDGVDSCPVGESGWISNATIDFDGDGCRDATEDADDDNDGLLDTFEIANGLDPLDATGDNGALGDADGDDFTNLEEQLAGSDASAATGASSNPGIFDFTSAAISVNEDAGTGSIAVTRSGGSVGAVSVLCFSTDIEAIADIDYTTVNTLLEWVDGDATDKACTFTITPDSDVEGNETFQLDLNNPSGGAKLGAP